MKIIPFISLIIFTFLLAGCTVSNGNSTKSKAIENELAVNVRTHEAKGDGKTDNTMAFLAADATFPNEQAASPSLILKAEVKHKNNSSNKFPLITVTFKNSSTNSFALLNHFAYAAIGPSLTARIPDGSANRGFREYIFDEQISSWDKKPKWIVLAPNETYIFKSRISRQLPAGQNRLRVFYMVGPAAYNMIKECKKDPTAPKVFWQGCAFSNFIELNNNGRTIKK